MDEPESEWLMEQVGRMGAGASVGERALGGPGIAPCQSGGPSHGFQSVLDLPSTRRRCVGTYLGCPVYTDPSCPGGELWIECETSGDVERVSARMSAFQRAMLADHRAAIRKQERVMARNLFSEEVAHYEEKLNRGG